MSKIKNVLVLLIILLSVTSTASAARKISDDNPWIDDLPFMPFLKSLSINPVLLSIGSIDNPVIFQSASFYRYNNYDSSKCVYLINFINSGQYETTLTYSFAPCNAGNEAIIEYWASSEGNVVIYDGVYYPASIRESITPVPTTPAPTIAPTQTILPTEPSACGSLEFTLNNQCVKILPIPGFEAIFAIAGLVLTAHLIITEDKRNKRKR